MRSGSAVILRRGWILHPFSAQRGASPEAGPTHPIATTYTPGDDVLRRRPDGAPGTGMCLWRDPQMGGPSYSFNDGSGVTGLRRVRRSAAVAALALLVASAPLAVSVTTEGSGARDSGPPQAPEAVPAVAPGPRGRGAAEIRLLGVNDLHGYLEKTKESAGAAYLDASMDRYEAQRPERTIRVHAGDMVSASPLVSAHFHDEPTVLAMNRMGFDVGTLGNHEFDEGGEEMLRLIDGGQREDAGERSEE